MEGVRSGGTRPHRRATTVMTEKLESTPGRDAASEESEGQLHMPKSLAHTFWAASDFAIGGPVLWIIVKLTLKKIYHETHKKLV